MLKVSLGLAQAEMNCSSLAFTQLCCFQIAPRTRLWCHSIARPSLHSLIAMPGESHICDWAMLNQSLEYSQNNRERDCTI